MKTIFLGVAIILITACTFPLCVAAQNDLKINQEDMPDLSRPLIINDITEGSAKDNTASINKRAENILQKKFPEAVNPSWYEISNGIIASFDKDAVKTKVYFDKKGRLNYSIKYYDEKLMPADVKHVVKSVYYDYSILNVSEINPNNAYAQTTYIILIEDTKNLKILTVSDNEIVSVKDYQKA